MRWFLLFILVAIGATYGAATFNRSPGWVRNIPAQLGLKNTPTWSLPDFGPREGKRAPKAGSVIVTMKNGNIVSGRIVEENDRRITLAWQDGTIGIERAEIEKIEKDVEIRGNQGVLAAG